MKNEKDLQTVLWRSFSLFLTVALTINGMKAILTGSQFAYWHIPTLLFSVTFSRFPWTEWVKQARLSAAQILEHLKQFARALRPRPSLRQNENTI